MNAQLSPTAAKNGAGIGGYAMKSLASLYVGDNDVKVKSTQTAQELMEQQKRSENRVYEAPANSTIDENNLNIAGDRKNSVALETPASGERKVQYNYLDDEEYYDHHEYKEDVEEITVCTS